MIVALDFGHGLSIDPGIGVKIPEEGLIDNFGKVLEQKLVDSSCQVYHCRPPYLPYRAKKEDSWRFRASVAKASHADLLLSIHFGCSLQRNGTVIFCKDCQEIGAKISLNLQNLGFYQNPPTNELPGVLPYCEMPGIFLDILSCFDLSDVGLYYRVGAETVAEAIASAVVNT